MIECIEPHVCAGATTSFVYDGANAVQERQGGTATANKLTGGVDQVFRRTDANGSRTLVPGALGSA